MRGINNRQKPRRKRYFKGIDKKRITKSKTKSCKGEGLEEVK